MNHFRATFIGGLHDATRLRLALPLYITGLVLGLLQTWPLLTGLATGQVAQFDLRQLLTSSDALIAMLSSQQNATAAAGWALILPVFSLIYGLAYNLFSGGILSVWAGQRRFWAGSRRFFWAFTGLGLLITLAAIALASFASVLASVAGLPALAVGLGVAALLQLLNLVGEYARAIAVVRERRNPFMLLGASITFCLRQPGSLVLGLLGVALHAALAALYLVLLPRVGTAPFGMLLDQSLIVSWLWVKLVRLAWARRLVQYAAESAMPVLVAPGATAAF